MNTYMTMYTEEIRVLEIMARDQYDIAFNPDMASSLVQTANGDVVQESAACRVEANKVFTTIGTGVSVAQGLYHVIWKIEKGSSIYYHKTVLNVKEI